MEQKKTFFRDRPFNLKLGEGEVYGFDFHFFFYFVWHKSHIFFLHNLKWNWMPKTLDQLIYITLFQIRLLLIFVLQLWESKYFFIPPFSKIVHPVKKSKQTNMCLKCNTRRSNSLLLRGYTLISSQKV